MKKSKKYEKKIFFSRKKFYVVKNRVFGQKKNLSENERLILFLNKKTDNIIIKKRSRVLKFVCLHQIEILKFLVQKVGSWVNLIHWGKEREKRMGGGGGRKSL